MREKKTILEKRESSRQRGRFALEDRLKALEVLKANKYDYKKTAIQTGCSIGTLYNWNSMYRNELEKSTAIQLAGKVAQSDFLAYKHRFLQGHFDDLERVAKKTVLKIENKLDQDNIQLKDLARVLEVFYNYLEKLSNENSPQSNPNSPSAARTQINILNAAGHKKSDDNQVVEIEEG